MSWLAITETYAQNAADVTWSDCFAEIMAEEGDEEAETWLALYDMLDDMAQHPLNINTATREELEALAFLTEKQVEELCEYLHFYGPMKSLNELKMIESLDFRRRRLLQCIVVAGKPDERMLPKLGDIMKYGKNTVTTDAKIPLYERKGDRNGYLGYKYKHWLKYDFNFNNRIRVGAVGSQDAGEPFLSKGNGSGYDYYSFYLQLKDMGRIENLTVGRYKLKMGMGLVANSSFNIGKASTVTGIGRNGNIIRVHSSRSEADYLQGAAATVRITKGLKATAFASYRPLDATLNDDGTVRTIISAGYHRTTTEMEKKNNMHATDAGANISFNAKGMHVGATVMATHLDRELHPYSSQLYRKYFPAGYDFVNTAADYGYCNHRIEMNGETAIDKNGEVATINSIAVNIGDKMRLTLLQRYYSYKYAALHANSFSDGGEVRNESGLYLGGEWKPSPNLAVTAYTDYAYFAAPRYRISEASHSYDNMVSATWQSRGWKAGARYRLRLRQRDSSRDDKLIAYNTHRIRTYAAYDSDGKWGCRTQADITVAEYLQRETGWMLTESIYAKRKWMRVDLSAAYFNAESYESRVYAYEKMLPQTFGSISFFGKGIRYSLTARSDIGKHIMFAAKIGVTNYFNRSTISSGYQTINASSMADIEMQARIKW